jgi:hypothetical protein
MINVIVLVGAVLNEGFKYAETSLCTILSRVSALRVDRPSIFYIR